MSGSNNHAGLNLSTRKLQVVEIFGSREQIRLDNLNEAAFPQPLNFKSDEENIILSQLQVAYDEMRKNQPVKSDTLSFSLPLDLFYISQLPYDNTLLQRDLIEEFRWAYSIMFPFVKNDDLILQYLEVEKNMIYTKNTAIVYGIERKYLKLLEKFCEQNYLKLGFIDNVHLSSESALALSNSFINVGLRLSVYISEKLMSIIFSLDGRPISQKIHAISNYDDISQNILEEISLSKSKNIIKGLIQASYITGETLPDSVVKSLNDTTGLNFILFNPFDKLTADPLVKENPFYYQNYNSFSSAAGIACRIG
jgi:Tfp pilus assembly PilM family ATPase